MEHLAKCLTKGKICYPTKAEAKKAKRWLTRIKDRFPEKLKIYWCEHHQAYHLAKKLRHYAQDTEEGRD